MRNFLFIVILLSSIPCASQQQINFKQLSKHKFTDGYKVGKLHDFRHHFKVYHPEYKMFKSFNRARVTQITFNAIYGTALGLSIPLIIYDSNSCNTNTNCGLGGAILLAADLVVIIFGAITNLIVGSAKERRKKRLLKQHFSDDYYGEIKKSKNNLSLEFSGTHNGIGVVLKF